MSYIRTDGYSLKDPDDDAAFQVMVGDMQRLALAMYKGSPNSAYVMAPWAAAAINGVNGYNGIGSLAGGPGASGVDGAGPGGVAGGAGGAGSPGGPGGAATVSPPGLDPSDNLSDLTDTNEALSNIGIGRWACVPSITTTYTSGSGTHTFNITTRRFVMYIVGGGGGGGGGSAGTWDDVIGGQGGGAGAMIMLTGATGGGASVTYAVGTGGALGAENTAMSSATAGTTGDASSVTTALGVYSAGGGLGGSAIANYTTYSCGFGGDPSYPLSIWPLVIGTKGAAGNVCYTRMRIDSPISYEDFGMFGGPGGDGHRINGVAGYGKGGVGGDGFGTFATDGVAGSAGVVVICESPGTVSSSNPIL